MDAKEPLEFLNGHSQSKANANVSETGISEDTGSKRGEQTRNDPRKRF